MTPEHTACELENTLRDQLPSIEQIERELGMDGGTDPAEAGRAGV